MLIGEHPREHLERPFASISSETQHSAPERTAGRYRLSGALLLKNYTILENCLSDFH